jgi:hypothetical protein
VVGSVTVGGCVSDPIAEEITVAGYGARMTEICSATRSALAELGTPPTEITTVDFANEVARLLATEADAARATIAPDELDDDHRAFVQNTDQQVTAWRALADIAATASDDSAALGEARTRIGELTLGRDDLAADMGLDACRAGGSS